ncbi:hypothetical protein Tco_1047793 [Tanacetum coccineum]
MEWKCRSHLYYEDEIGESSYDWTRVFVQETTDKVISAKLFVNLMLEYLLETKQSSCVLDRGGRRPVVLRYDMFGIVDPNMQNENNIVISAGSTIMVTTGNVIVTTGSIVITTGSILVTPGRIILSLVLNTIVIGTGSTIMVTTGNVIVTTGSIVITTSSILVTLGSTNVFVRLI